MSDRLILAFVILIVALPIAFILDRNRWRKRPREDLERILRDGDWTRVGAALKEIKRRGEDIAPYLAVVLGLMTSDSSSARTAGKLALQEHFPQIASEVPKFNPTGPAEARAAILAPLLQKYGVTKHG